MGDILVSPDSSHYVPAWNKMKRLKTGTSDLSLNMSIIINFVFNWWNKICEDSLLPLVLQHTFHRSQQRMSNQTDGHVCQTRKCLNFCNWRSGQSLKWNLHPNKGRRAFIWSVRTIYCPELFRFVSLYLPETLNNKS